MTNHSPSPWKCVPAFTTASQYDVFDVNGNFHAKGNISAEEMQANANLIAASPQMYLALIDFVSVCEHAPPIELVDRIGLACEKAKAAIRAATEGK